MKDSFVRNNFLELKFLKVIDKVYLFSIYILLLNSIWYFIRLLIFDRKIEAPPIEIENGIEIIFLISALIAMFRYYKFKIKNNTLSLLLRSLFVAYAILGVSMTINKTYFDISPAVKYHWESGEWNF